MVKEQYEWIHSWCDDTLKKDLPRVLLIGDSITYNYQEMVREQLKGVAYVDYIATSYAIDMRIYRDLIKSFEKDSKYDIIHFNHGLHGKNMTKRTYFLQVKKLLENFTCKKIILATSTIIYKEGNKELDDSWNKKVYERNDAVIEIAKANNYFVDDLYTVSINIPKENRYVDGTHYLKEGYLEFAKQVSNCIKKNL